MLHRLAFDAALLDGALVLVLVLHLARGWHTGGVRSLLTMGGAVGGGALALWATPRALDRWAPAGTWLDGTLGRVLVVLASIWAAAAVMEVASSSLAPRLQPRGRLHRPDALLGAVVHGVLLCVLAASLGSAVRPSLPTRWSQTLNRSRVLPLMGELSPAPVTRWATLVGGQLGELGFPRVFSGVEPEPELPVPTPDGSAGQAPAVRAAAASIVKVTTSSTACQRGSEGSGWVVAPHRVVTNAHVVAGADRLRVQAAGRGARLEARVVAFDPALDLAVLAVDDLAAPALKRSGPLEDASSAVVAGFPLDGAYTVRAARVRGTVKAAGDDIHGRHGSVREVYSLHTVVQPGNSGGPLLTPRGTVAGTVFARSTVDAQTGYALTDRATDRLLDAAATLHQTVGTQGCTRG